MLGDFIFFEASYAPDLSSLVSQPQFGVFSPVMLYTFMPAEHEAVLL